MQKREYQTIESKKWLQGRARAVTAGKPSYFALSYLALSCPPLSYPILSYPALSCPILVCITSCLMMSYHIISYSILGRLFVPWARYYPPSCEQSVLPLPLPLHRPPHPPPPPHHHHRLPLRPSIEWYYWLCSAD